MAAFQQTDALLNFFLVLLAVVLRGKLPVYALIGVEFFMSIMFPTIFSLSIRGLGAKTKEGSSLVIMAIVGGAVFPVLMGRVSDLSTIQTAYVVGAVLSGGVLLCAQKPWRQESTALGGPLSAYAKAVIPSSARNLGLPGSGKQPQIPPAARNDKPGN